jgi:c-di-GMP-related signal transduction protein
MPAAADTRSAIHVARQPILDTRRQVVGYELLYRGHASDSACTIEGDIAGSRVLIDALLSIGLGTLAPKSLAFINFTRPLILDGAALVLPKKAAVIELREDIYVDGALIDACKELCLQGFTLALDDFVAGSDAEKLLPYVKYVKLDVLANDAWKTVARRVAAPGRRVVAERVETHQVAIEATRAGCTLFQGFFFCRPETCSARALPTQRQAYLSLFAALSRPELTIAELEELVKHDVSLTVRILRSINSAAFGIQHQITSVRQALVLLGVQQVRRWATVWAMAGLSVSAPPEVIMVTLMRARMCEAIGRVRFGEAEASELFLLGMCSTLDVILDQPLDKALETLPISPRVRGALLGESGDGRAVLDLVLARERGDWNVLPDMQQKLRLSESVISAAYLDALQWAHQHSQETVA